MDAKRNAGLLTAIVNFCLWAAVPPASPGQNAIIAVIDGPRCSEAFGNPETFVPKMAAMAAEGTFFPNFTNDGRTLTNPGHAAILTGTWQPLPNDGTQRPSTPTLFEYFRKEDHSPRGANYAIVGKSKLNVLTHSSHSDYGQDFCSSFLLGLNDVQVFQSAVSVMQAMRPRLVIINFPSVDVAGHAGHFPAYLEAIRTIDSMMAELWRFIRTDPFYKDSTTLLITADHGRHDDGHGGFQHHGDNCAGCRQIFLIALGRGIPAGEVRGDHASQIDIAPTVAGLLGFSAPLAEGRDLFPNAVASTDPSTGHTAHFDLRQNYPNPFNPSTTISYSLAQSADVRFSIFDILGREVFSREKTAEPPGEYRLEWNGRSSDGRISPSGVYFYRLEVSSGQVMTRKMMLLR